MGTFYNHKGIPPPRAEPLGRNFPMRPIRYSNEICCVCLCWTKFDGAKAEADCLYECTPNPIKLGQQKFLGVR